ncbi:hypothetical protein CQW23_10270 [Capsicum baccatum]|uniref:Uncharacterized protein n=1 Tax=Capsicum baccatum TaxID=33114 RepID=A0A2G2WZ79_CAPBA|nr:hypothetical protein CQW23_10270 [Capsicum baccatum]
MNPVAAEKAAGLETDLKEVLNAWYSAGFYTGKTLQITPLDEEDQEEAQIDNSGDVDSYNDDDEKEEDEDKEPVGLGVLEKPENSWSLQRELFPSKAGGTPAWLDPVNLPTGKSCLCDFCIEPLQFMLQLFFVAGVVPGEEIKYVVVAEEYITALRNTRSAAVTVLPSLLSIRMGV